MQDRKFIEDFLYPLKPNSSPNEIKLHISLDFYQYEQANEIIELFLQENRSHIHSAKQIHPAIVRDKRNLMKGEWASIHYSEIPRFAIRGRFYDVNHFNGYYNEYLSNLDMHCIVDSQWTIYLSPGDVDSQEVSALIVNLSDLLRSADIRPSAHSAADEPIDEYFSIRRDMFNGSYVRYKDITQEHKEIQRRDPLIKKILDGVNMLSSSPRSLFSKNINTLREDIPKKFKTNPLTQSKKDILDYFYNYIDLPENRLKTPEDIIKSWVVSYPGYPHFNPLRELNEQRREGWLAFFNPSYTNSIQTFMRYVSKEVIIGLMENSSQNDIFNNRI